MNNTQTQLHQVEFLNGLNTEQLFQTIDAVKEEPSLAHFEFRAKNQWINGGENRSTIQGFYGVGAEDESRDKPFVFTNGEPPVLLGNNEGANPVEFLLHALAGCLTTTIVLSCGINSRRRIQAFRRATSSVATSLRNFLSCREGGSKRN